MTYVLFAVTWFVLSSALTWLLHDPPKSLGWYIKVVSWIITAITAIIAIVNFFTSWNVLNIH
jgi:hypothetical protein